MKYIITESKLDNIIEDFITEQFSGLKRINYGKHREVWVRNGREGQPVIIILSDDKYFEILILEDVYSLIVNMFSMNGFHEIQIHLVRWFEKHMGLKVAEVETFDNEGHDYAY